MKELLKQFTQLSLEEATKMSREDLLKIANHIELNQPERANKQELVICITKRLKDQPDLLTVKEAPKKTWTLGLESMVDPMEIFDSLFSELPKNIRCYSTNHRRCVEVYYQTAKFSRKLVELWLYEDSRKLQLSEWGGNVKQTVKALIESKVKEFNETRLIVPTIQPKEEPQEEVNPEFQERLGKLKFILPVTVSIYLLSPDQAQITYKNLQGFDVELCYVRFTDKLELFDWNSKAIKSFQKIIERKVGQVNRTYSREKEETLENSPIVPNNGLLKPFESSSASEDQEALNERLERLRLKSRNLGRRTFDLWVLLYVLGNNKGSEREALELWSNGYFPSDVLFLAACKEFQEDMWNEVFKIYGSGTLSHVQAQNDSYEVKDFYGLQECLFSAAAKLVAARFLECLNNYKEK